MWTLERSLAEVERLKALHEDSAELAKAIEWLARTLEPRMKFPIGKRKRSRSRLLDSSPDSLLSRLSREERRVWLKKIKRGALETAIVDTLFDFRRGTRTTASGREMPIRYVERKPGQRYRRDERGRILRGAPAVLGRLSLSAFSGFQIPAGATREQGEAMAEAFLKNESLPSITLVLPENTQSEAFWNTLESRAIEAARRALWAETTMFEQSEMARQIPRARRAILLSYDVNRTNDEREGEPWSESYPAQQTLPAPDDYVREVIDHVAEVGSPDERRVWNELMKLATLGTVRRSKKQGSYHRYAKLIGDAVAMTPATVRSHLFRLKRKLQKSQIKIGPVISPAPYKPRFMSKRPLSLEEQFARSQGGKIEW